MRLAAIFLCILLGSVLAQAGTVEAETLASAADLRSVLDSLGRLVTIAAGAGTLFGGAAVLVMQWAYMKFRIGRIEVDVATIRTDLAEVDRKVTELDKQHGILASLFNREG